MNDPVLAKKIYLYQNEINKLNEYELNEQYYILKKLFSNVHKKISHYNKTHNLYKELTIREIRGFNDLFVNLKSSILDLYRDIAYIAYYMLCENDKQIPNIIDESMKTFPKDITNIITMYTQVKLNDDINHIAIIEVETYLRSKYSKKINIDIENIFFKELFDRFYTNNEILRQYFDGIFKILN